MIENIERYSIIEEKNKREIVLLLGSRCKYLKCAFCDYHMDYEKDEKKAFEFNKNVLNKVSGLYGKLEVINSGSFVDLDKNTLEYIVKIAVLHNINTLYFETHYMYINKIREFKAYLNNLFQKYNGKGQLKINMKCGIETFDEEFREKTLKKGINNFNLRFLRDNIDEICLLFGIKGQTKETMEQDIKIGKENFKRICVNIFKNNSSKIKEDKEVIDVFLKEIYPKIKDLENVDVLLNNTDFGVGSNL